MNLKLKVDAGGEQTYSQQFPPEHNDYSSLALVGGSLLPDDVDVMFPDPATGKLGPDVLVEVVAHQGPVAGTGAVIVTGQPKQPVTITKLVLDADDAPSVLTLRPSHPLRFGCSHVMRYGVASLQPSSVAIALLQRYVQFHQGVPPTLLQDLNDDDRLAMSLVMVERLKALTFIPNYPKHETQGGYRMCDWMLPHAVAAAFGINDAAEAFATFADQELAWRPIGNGPPPKDALYPSLYTALSAAGKPFVQADGKTPIPITHPDAQHVQGTQLGWGWLLYGDPCCAVALMRLWGVVKKFNVFTYPAKEVNPRAFGRCMAVAWWMAVSCPDMKLRFEAQQFLLWLTIYLRDRALLESSKYGIPVIASNPLSAEDESHHNCKNTLWMQMSCGIAPARVLRHPELMDLLDDKEREQLMAAAAQLLSLVGNVAAHAAQLGLQHGVPFVIEYDDVVQPYWRPNLEVSGTDLWILPTLRDVIELLPEHPFKDALTVSLVMAFENADALLIKPEVSNPADYQKYEALGVALDLMPSLGLRID